MDEPVPYPEEIENVIRRQTEEFFQAREEMCERAIQSGEFGVLVEFSKDPTTWRITLSKEVPYGWIYERRQW
jgi:hypothetical protein